MRVFCSLFIAFLTAADASGFAQCTHIYGLQNNKNKAAKRRQLTVAAGKYKATIWRSGENEQEKFNTFICMCP